MASFSCMHCGRNVLKGALHAEDCAYMATFRVPHQLEFEFHHESEDNLYRVPLMNLEITYRTQDALIELFAFGKDINDRIARHRFVTEWAQLIGSNDAEYYGNVETLLCFLACMSTKDVKAFIESFYWY